MKIIGLIHSNRTNQCELIAMQLAMRTKMKFSIGIGIRGRVSGPVKVVSSPACPLASKLHLIIENEFNQTIRFDWMGPSELSSDF